MSFPSSSEARLCYGGMPIWRSDYAPKCLLSKSPNDGTNRLRRSRRIEWCHHLEILWFEVLRSVMTFGGVPWIWFWKLKLLLPLLDMTIFMSASAQSSSLRIPWEWHRSIALDLLIPSVPFPGNSERSSFKSCLCSECFPFKDQDKSCLSFKLPEDVIIRFMKVRWIHLYHH